MIAYPMQRYEGPLEAGMVFRHKSFDIRCEVVEISGFHVVVYPMDCEGNRSTETMPHTIGSFRGNWMIERRAKERWAAPAFASTTAA